MQNARYRQLRDARHYLASARSYRKAGMRSDAATYLDAAALQVRLVQRGSRTSV